MISTSHISNSRANMLSICLVSAGALAFEVILTRIFSLTYWHHFAALLIGLALTGFGSAGSLLVLAMPWLEKRRAEALAVTALLAALAMPLAYLGDLAVDLKPLTLAWTPSAWIDLALVCLIMVVPFLLAGLHVGLVLAWAERPGWTYAANLAGSAVGCLVSAALLSEFLPHQSIYAASILLLAASLVHWQSCPRAIVVVLAGLALVGSVWLAVRPLPLRFEPFKDRSMALTAKGNRLLDQEVGLHGVVEIIGGPAFHYAPGLSLNCQDELPPQVGLFVDGDMIGQLTKKDAATSVMPWIECLLGRLSHELVRPKSLLLLKPGGGLGLLASQGLAAQKTVAVTDNSEIVAFMKGPWADFTGNIFNRPELDYRLADPTVYLSETEEKFDLIVLGQGVAWGAGAGSGLGITRLLTVEGLGLMLDRLAPNGVLALSGPLEALPRSAIKIMATAVEALAELKADPAQSLALIRDWNTVLILVKPSGFTRPDLERIRSLAAKGGFDLDLLPGLRPEEINRHHQLPGAPLAEAGRLLVSGRAEELYARSNFYLRPATRDQPYFFHFFSLRTLDLILDPNLSRSLAVTEWGLLFTWGGLLAVLILAAGGMLLPLARRRPPAGLPFFGFIGVGYMLAEITLLAETIYRIGRPALAVPLVVGVFLAASGLGSRLWGHRRPQPFVFAAAVILPLTLLVLRFLPGGALMTGLLLIPAALVMGVPMAGALTRVIGPEADARAWAFGLNGFCSVIGSLITQLIALHAGHTPAILAAALCYFLAGLTLCFKTVRTKIFQEEQVKTLLVTLLLIFILVPAAGLHAADDPCLAQRQKMVARQIQARGVTDEKVLGAMSRVPRHLFVPENRRDSAYSDQPLAIGYGQTISQPYMVAFMTESLKLKGGENALEIGTGSGYQAAVLAELGARVHSIEIVPELAAAAKERLAGLSCPNVQVRNGDGYYGWPDQGPFDAIIVTCAAGHIPPPLLKQLKPGGRMIIPVGQAFAVQTLVLVEKSAGGQVGTRSLMSVRFVPLVREK